MEFSKKVKTARVSLGISQEELAKRLNVSFATINRWENGKTTPNNLTQKVFIDFCANHHILSFDEEVVNSKKLLSTKEMSL